MSENRCSLCVTYKGNNGSKQYFRIADYDVNKKYLTEATYSEKDSDAYVFDPRIIGGQSRNSEIGTASLRDWIPLEEDRKKSDSELSTESFKIYEIIFPEQELLNGEIENLVDEIREILFAGIKIHQSTLEDIYLIVTQNRNRYGVLELKKNMLTRKNDVYVIPKTCTDFLHATHAVKMFYIDKRSLISTASIGIHLLDDNMTSAPERFFYNGWDYGSVVGLFKVRPVDAYVPVYISKKMKQMKETLHLSQTEIKRFISASNTVLDMKKEIEDFLAEIGFSESEINQAIERYRVDIKTLLGNDFESYIKKLILDDEELFEKIYKQVQENWFSDKDEERENLELKLKKLGVDYECKHAAFLELEELIDKNKGLLNQQQLELERIKDEQIKIKSDIDAELKELENNIVRRYILKACAGSHAEDKHNVFIVDGESNADNTVQYDDIDDVYDVLENNLIHYGIKSNYAYDLGKFLIACLLGECNLIVNGNAEILSNSLAATLTNKTADVVFFDSNEVKNIINQITNATSNIFIVEDAIDIGNEAKIITLSQRCKGNLLLFSACTRHGELMVDDFVWDNILYIDLDKYLELKKSEMSLQYGVLSIDDIRGLLEGEVTYKEAKKLFDTETSEQMKKAELKTLINLYVSGGLNKDNKIIKDVVNTMGGSDEFDN